MTSAVFTTGNTNYSVTNLGKTVEKISNNQVFDHARVDLVANGKVYCELVVDWGGTNTATDGDPGYHFLGIVPSGTPYTEFPGEGSNSFGYRGISGQKCTGFSNSTYGDSVDNYDILGIAYDSVAGKIWWSLNGVWQNSGDPANGTGFAFDTVTGDQYVAVGLYYETQTITLHSEPSEMTYTAPTGFTSGLALANLTIEGDLGLSGTVDGFFGININVEGNLGLAGVMEVTVPAVITIQSALTLAGVITNDLFNVIDINGSLSLSGFMITEIPNMPIVGKLKLSGTMDVANNVSTSISGAFALSGDVDMLRINKDVSIVGSFGLYNVISIIHDDNTCELPSHDQSRWT